MLTIRLLVRVPAKCQAIGLRVLRTSVNRNSSWPGGQPAKEQAPGQCETVQATKHSN